MREARYVLLKVVFCKYEFGLQIYSHLIDNRLLQSLVINGVIEVALGQLLEVDLVFCPLALYFFHLHSHFLGLFSASGAHFKLAEVTAACWLEGKAVLAD